MLLDSMNRVHLQSEFREIYAAGFAVWVLFRLFCFLLLFLKKRQGILDGVAVSGGEPLLQKDIADFLYRIKEMGFAVKLDTNGSFPKKLRSLAEASLIDYVAMDIKAPLARYSELAGVEIDQSAIAESAAFLLSGHLDYEFRTTLVKP